MTTKELETLRNEMIAAVNNTFDKLPVESVEEKTISADDARKARIMDGLNHCCTPGDGACDGCPYYTDIWEGLCSTPLLRDARWAIGNLNAEIAALKEPRKLPDEMRERIVRVANALRDEASAAQDTFSYMAYDDGVDAIKDLIAFIDDKHEGGQACEHDTEHPPQHRP